LKKYSIFKSSTFIITNESGRSFIIIALSGKKNGAAYPYFIA